MASPDQTIREDGKVYQPYRKPTPDLDEASEVRRKPVPQWHQDIQSSPNPRQDFSAPVSPFSTRFQSFGSQYFPIAPNPSVQPVDQGVRPEPFTAESFHSTNSLNSSFSTETYNSDARLLGTPSAGNTPKFPPPNLGYHSTPPPPSRILPWWNPVWQMYVMFVLGVAGALSHHFFYDSLAGTEAHDQLGMLRYGAAIAYFTKAMLVTSLLLAFRQQIWATFRRKALTIDAVDGLFAVTEDFSAMLNLEVLRQAKVALFLALIIWLAPLAAILTPASLTVEPSLQTNSTTCSSVRTLNFAPEAAKDWRVPLKIAGLNELSLSFWNTTSKIANDSNSFDYYDQPSYPIAQVATLSAYLQRTVVRTNASIDICGAGWNCSFVISFQGPGYKCGDQSGPGDSPAGSTIGTPPFTIDQIYPEGKAKYLALTSLGDYVPSQVDSGEAGIPSKPPPYPKHLGSFRTEPVLWFGYSALREPDEPVPLNSSDPRWANAFEKKIFACEHYNTNYTILFNYTSGVQSTTVLNRTFLSPVVNTTYVAQSNANDGTKDPTTAVPEENYINPQDVAKYRLTAAYHSLGFMLRKFVNGTIEVQGTASITKTEATKTKLIDPRNYFAKPDLMNQLQFFYEDIILSLFSNPQFLAVAWAANPSQLSGTAPGTMPEHQYVCTKSRMLNIFVYHARDLWLIYGATIVLTALGVALGSAAVSQNGWKLRNTHFSSIVAATRGRGLDRLPWKTSAWGELSGEVGRARVGYGIIGAHANHGQADENAAGWSESYGFGLEDEVRQGIGTQRTRGRVLTFKRWHYTYN